MTRIVGIVVAVNALHVTHETEQFPGNGHIAVNPQTDVDRDKSIAMPLANGEQVCTSAGIGLIVFFQLIEEFVGGKEIGIIGILEQIVDIFSPECIGTQRGVSTAHTGQMNVTARGRQCGVQLQAVLRTVHEIGRAHELCVAHPERAGKQ